MRHKKSVVSVDQIWTRPLLEKLVLARFRQYWMLGDDEDGIIYERSLDLNSRDAKIHNLHDFQAWALSSPDRPATEQTDQALNRLIQTRTIYDIDKSTEEVPVWKEIERYPTLTANLFKALAKYGSAATFELSQMSALWNAKVPIHYVSDQDHNLGLDPFWDDEGCGFIWTRNQALSAKTLMALPNESMEGIRTLFGDEPNQELEAILKRIALAVRHARQVPAVAAQPLLDEIRSLAAHKVKPKQFGPPARLDDAAICCAVFSMRKRVSIRASVDAVTSCDEAIRKLKLLTSNSEVTLGSQLRNLASGYAEWLDSLSKLDGQDWGTWIRVLGPFDSPGGYSTLREGITNTEKLFHTGAHVRD